MPPTAVTEPAENPPPFGSQYPEFFHLQLESELHAVVFFEEHPDDCSHQPLCCFHSHVTFALQPAAEFGKEEFRKQVTALGSTKKEIVDQEGQYIIYQDSTDRLMENVLANPGKDVSIPRSPDW